jgi:hypothetical protein
MSINSVSAVYQSSIDRLHALVTADDGYLYDNYWDGSQWQWQTHEAPPAPVGSSGPAGGVFYPAAVYQSSIDRVVAFVLGEDGNLYLNFSDGSNPSGQWESQGTPVGPFFGRMLDRRRDIGRIGHRPAGAVSTRSV